MKAFYPLVGFPHHLLPNLRLLVHFIGSCNLFAAGSVVSLVLLGGSGGLRSSGLGYLGAYFRGIYNDKGVAFLHRRAFLGAEFLYSARNLSGHAIFRSLGFTLDYVGLGLGDHISHH